MSHNDFRGGPGSDCDGDSDSNDENNWRNEYPDEDDDNGEDEEYNEFAYDEDYDDEDFGLGRKMRLSDEDSVSSKHSPNMKCGILILIQRSTLLIALGLVKFVPALARLFCLALPGSFLTMFAQNKGDLCTAEEVCGDF